MRLLNMLLQIT